MVARMNPAPSINAVIRIANRTAFEGETFDPADIVATSAITKAITGAKYH